MNRILLTYDVSGHHTQVKNELFNLGHYDRWTFNSKIHYLPNTVVWKKGITSEQAIKDLDTAVANVNRNLPANDKIRIERALAVHFSDWWGYCGDPHSGNRPAPQI